MSSPTLPTKPKLTMQEQIRLNKQKAAQQAGQFFPADILGDDLGKAPMQNQGIPMEEFDVRWWFEYFWSEAKMRATEEGRVQLAAICNRIYKKTPNSPVKYELKPEFAHPNGGANASAWYEILTSLLKLGFRCVTPDALVRIGPQPLPSIADTYAHCMLQKDYIHQIDPGVQIEIWWRSEMRTREKIIQQGGTRRQIDVESIAASMNMDKPWHPFSKEENSKFLWFRLGNADNDYYTVISVAKTYETCLSFPKIDEKRIYGFPPVDCDKWTPAQADKFKDYLGLVRMADGGKKVRVITKTTAYMYAEYNSTLDTQGYGATFASDKKGFDELGTSFIPLDCIFATIPITRVHHGLAPEDGFTVFADWRTAEKMKDLKQSRDQFGSSFNLLMDEYMKQKYRPVFASAWCKTGFAQPRIPMQIQSISEHPLSLSAFAEFKKTLVANQEVTRSDDKYSNLSSVPNSIAARIGNPLAGLKPVTK